MLNFELIKNLDKHFDYIKKKVNTSSFFLVGGCIRNILLGTHTADLLDIDLTMPGEPAHIYDQIDRRGFSTFITEKFGTITLIPRENKKLKYEITPFRQESTYRDFRHPDKIHWTSDLLKDSNRRDFTINCLYYFKTSSAAFKPKAHEQLKDTEKFLKILNKDGLMFLVDSNVLILQNHETIKKIFPKGIFDEIALDRILTKQIGYGFTDQINKNKNLSIIIDPHRGIHDLIDRQIKAVGKPDKRFKEDALRIVRAVRFLNILNIDLLKKKQDSFFNIDNETWNSMLKNSKLVKNVAKERIKDEMLKVFKQNNPFGFISLLDKLDLLKYLLPALAKTKFVDQPIRYHPFDVYTHTMLTLYAIQKLNKDPLVKLGMLYHDVGKPIQYSYTEKNLSLEEIRKITGSDIHHPNLGEKMTLEDMINLGLSRKQADEVAFYVKHHMLIGDIVRSNPENIEKKLKKLLSDFGYKKTKNLIDICIADRLGHYNPVQPPALDEIYQVKKLLRQIYLKQGEFGIKDMAINGNDIINKLGINPGPKVGEILNTALEWTLEDVADRNDKDKIINYLKGFYHPKK